MTAPCLELAATAANKVSEAYGSERQRTHLPGRTTGTGTAARYERELTPGRTSP